MPLTTFSFSIRAAVSFQFRIRSFWLIFECLIVKCTMYRNRWLKCRLLNILFECEKWQCLLTVNCENGVPKSDKQQEKHRTQFHCNHTMIESIWQRTCSLLSNLNEKWQNYYF